MSWGSLIAAHDRPMDRPARIALLPCPPPSLPAPITPASTPRRRSRGTTSGDSRRICASRSASTSPSVTPDTPIPWHRQVIANKYYGSKRRGQVGRVLQNCSPTSSSVSPWKTPPGSTPGFAATWQSSATVVQPRESSRAVWVNGGNTWWRWSMEPTTSDVTDLRAWVGLNSPSGRSSRCVGAWRCSNEGTARRQVRRNPRATAPCAWGCSRCWRCSSSRRARPTASRRRVHRSLHDMVGDQRASESR